MPARKNSSRSLFFLFLLLSLSSLSSPAFADAGTPLMWTTFFHLFIGNALIGVVEGLMIKHYFHPLRRFVIPVMILANYVSMFMGMVLIPYFYEFLTPSTAIPHLAATPGILWKMTLLTFLATLLIEWPFCFWIFGKHGLRLKYSILANLMAQTASYAVLIPLYLYSSIGLQLFKDVQVNQSVVASLPERGTIYFLSPDERSLCSIALNGTNLKRECEIPLIDQDPNKLDWGYHAYRLAALPAKAVKAWDLWVRDDQPVRTQQVQNGVSSGSLKLLLLSNIAGRAAIPEESHSFSKFAPADFRPANQRQWDLLVDTYGPMSNLVARHPHQPAFSFFVETPFMRWDGRFPTVLPGDRVVFEFGGQILLLDLNRRKIGFIANGEQPVVILDDAAEKGDPAHAS